MFITMIFNKWVVKYKLKVLAVWVQCTRITNYTPIQHLHCNVCKVWEMHIAKKRSYQWRYPFTSQLRHLLLTSNSFSRKILINPPGISFMSSRKGVVCSHLWRSSFSHCGDWSKADTTCLQHIVIWTGYKSICLTLHNAKWDNSGK